MKSVGIFYFSGTGNTEIVGDMFRKQFLQNGYCVDMLRMEDVLKNNIQIDVKKYDLIGIGCQVIGFSIPNIVPDFIRVLPKGNDKRVFIFRTAGGVAPINYNASKTMIKKLSRKGYNVFHERVFSIGSNWMVRFDDGVVMKLYEATVRKTAIMCREVINGEKRILKTGLKLGIIMGIAMRIFPPMIRLVGKDLFVNKSCTHCGLCIKNCPSRNIYDKKDKIKFKFSCNSCLRCVYTCPQNAIKFRILKFFPIPGGYNIKKILQSPSDTSSLGKSSIPPFFNDYIKNDAL